MALGHIRCYSSSSPMTYQTTIERPVATKGVGLHTAVKSHLRLVPAPANTGIIPPLPTSIDP